MILHRSLTRFDCAMAFSDPQEAIITWTGVSSQQAILTTLAVPSDCEYILMSYRVDHPTRDRFSATFRLPYATWNAFTAVSAGDTVAVDNRRTWIYRGENVTMSPFLAKGTGDVLAVGVVEGSGDLKKRFDLIEVVYVTGEDISEAVIVAKDDEPDETIEDTDSLMFIDPTTGSIKTISVSRVRTWMQQGLTPPLK